MTPAVATTEKRRWPLEFATMVADLLIAHLAPYCKRIEVAGSIRRRKAMIGDIELLCIPDIVPLHNLLGEVTGQLDTLDLAIQQLIKTGFLAYRLNREGHRAGYGPKNKLLLHVSSGMPVDVFTATERNWGMALAVRTGPKSWNIRMMSRFREIGLRGHAYEGVEVPDGEEIPVPTEEVLFQLLRWPYVPPEGRE